LKGTLDTTKLGRWINYYQKTERIITDGSGKEKSLWCEYDTQRGGQPKNPRKWL